MDLWSPETARVELEFLGAMLDDMSRLDSVRAAFRPDYFGAVEHKQIYDGILAVADRHADKPLWGGDNAVDCPAMTFVGHWLQERHPRSPPTDCWLGVLSEAWDCTVGVNYESLAEMIYGDYRQRILRGTGLEIHTGKVPPENFAEVLAGLPAAMRPRLTTRRENYEALSAAMDKSKEGSRRLPFQIPELTGRGIGMAPGYPTVIGGRPGAGKSTFLIEVLARNALYQVPSVMISMEMKNADVMARALGMLGSIDTNKIINDISELDDDDYDRMAVAQGAMYGAPFIVEGDGIPLTVEKIEMLVAQHVAEHGVRLFGVDHLRQVDMPPHLKPYEAQSQRIIELGMIAKKYDVVMLVAAQVNRAAQGSGTRGAPPPPQMHNLEGSGAIEQEADMVLLLSNRYDNSGDEPEQRRDSLRCEIAKNRTGPVDTIALPWFPVFCRVGSAWDQPAQVG